MTGECRNNLLVVGGQSPNTWIHAEPQFPVFTPSTLDTAAKRRAALSKIDGQLNTPAIDGAVWGLKGSLDIWKCSVAQLAGPVRAVA